MSYGIDKERQVIAHLKAKGFNVTSSSVYENKRLDIDCWIGDEPVSIKSPTPRSVHEFKRIVLELYVMFPDGTWQPSWFYSGQAHTYLFCLDDELWTADRSQLKEYVNQHKGVKGDKTCITKRLSAKVKQAQKSKGHPHRDAELVNVSIPRLKTDGIITHLSTLPNQRDHDAWDMM